MSVNVILSSDLMVEVHVKFEPLLPTRNDRFTKGHCTGDVQLETVKQEIKYAYWSAELESTEKKKKHEIKHIEKKTSWA